jgi:hypothetical protein
MRRCVALTMTGLFLAAGLFATGCASRIPESSPKHPITGVNPDGTPKWVRRGSGAYDGDNGKAFYGVGLLAGIKNPALARQTVDNRARGEIAKMFDLYVAAMMKDYQRSTTAGDFKASAEEQDVVSAQKTITEVVVRGIEIRDHWTDPKTGTQYGLAVLQLDNVMKSLTDMKKLNTKVRDYVRANARRAFNDLDKELRKRTSRGK